MKLCGNDCVVQCANCRHWQPEDRFEGLVAPCVVTGSPQSDCGKCRKFVCVNRDEKDKEEM